LTPIKPNILGKMHFPAKNILGLLHFLVKKILGLLQILLFLRLKIKYITHYDF